MCHKQIFISGNRGGRGIISNTKLFYILHFKTFNQFNVTELEPEHIFIKNFIEATAEEQFSFIVYLFAASIDVMIL